MPKTRITDPGTSFQAASSVQNVTTTQAFILKALRKKAVSDTELIVAYRAYKTAPVASESGIRSRRAELVEQGLVEDSGRRVKLASGRHAIVWQVA